MAVIRVSFQADTSPATTGNGQFVLEALSGIACEQWEIDPPPHDSHYFMDHLSAADNYWKKVSNGNVRLDLQGSRVFPDAEQGSYELPHNMVYYHPYLETFNETEKLFELARDAIVLADPDVDFSNFSTIILVHAGMGGDFAFVLDPTPGNIPSAYLSADDFNEYGVLGTDEGPLNDLIIIPESQNFLQYPETRTLFEEAEDPCFYQVGLNGTLALMFGFHLGLPPLYNTETGRSLVGGFALMDQGSNNFHGIVPAFPDPYTRIRMGWETPQLAYINDDVSIHVDDAPVRVDISATEYYLFENHQRNLLEPDSLILWIDDAGYDTVSVALSDRGVVLDVDEQDAGLPGNGLYIWHIDESAWFSDENPNGGPIQVVDFVEADGAQDMGYDTQLIFADFLETGWWFDPWFGANAGWFDLNRNTNPDADSLLTFSNETRPATLSNTGTPSYLRFEDISRNGTTMTFSVRSDRVIPSEGLSAILGWNDSRNEFWALNSDSSAILRCRITEAGLLTQAHPTLAPAQLFEDAVEEVLQFTYPWVVTTISTGIRFINIETGSYHFDTSNEEAFELSVNGHSVKYFARRGADTYYLVHWNSLTNTSQMSALDSYPQTHFTVTEGNTDVTEVLYAAPEQLLPWPAAAAHAANIANQEFPSEQVIARWSHARNQLVLKPMPGSDEIYLDVDQPLTIIPVDPDEDGVAEIMLSYENQILVLTQNGTHWNGSPFSVESYHGTPLVGDFGTGNPVIWLRQAEAYSIYGFDGRKLDTGVLPAASQNPVNELGFGAHGVIVTSDALILDFPGSLAAGALVWTGPTGGRGDRTAVLHGMPDDDIKTLKSGSVYNYPNPVKGNRTTIRAWLGAVDTWRIDIYSLSGAHVESVEMPVEMINTYHEWVWDASDLSNGVYVASIQAGELSEIIKIAVIR